MAGFPYFPHTDADVQSMLDRIGVKKVEDLYADVPKEFIKKGAYALPDAMSEPEVRLAECARRDERQDEGVRRRRRV